MGRSPAKESALLVIGSPATSPKFAPRIFFLLTHMKTFTSTSTDALNVEEMFPQTRQFT